MNLTGKCKEDFVGWFYSLDRLNDRYFNSIEMFYRIPQSMQYGVMVDFSETVEDITQHKMVDSEQSYVTGGHSRPEARSFSAEKFNKRYNQNFK